MSTHLRMSLAALGAVLAAARVQAAEAVAETTPLLHEGPRTLNGHTYQPSNLIIGPFVTTSFGMITFLGAGQSDAPRFDLQGNQIGTQKVTTATYGQAIEYDLRLTRNIGLRFNVNGLIFSGVNGKSTVVAGSTAQAGLLAGLTAGWNLGHTTRLAFLLDAGVEPQFSVLISNAIVRAIQTGTFETTDVFTTVSRLRVTPGLSFAWAPAPWFGLIAEAGYVWTRRNTRGGEDTPRIQTGVRLGGVASFDLDPLVRFPIAFQGSYRSDLPVGGDGIPNVRQVGLGVYYSARLNLALGLETVWRHGLIRPGVLPTLKSDSYITGIMLRYYW